MLGKCTPSVEFPMSLDDKAREDGPSRAVLSARSIEKDADISPPSMNRWTNIKASASKVNHVDRTAMAKQTFRAILSWFQGSR